MSLPPIFPASYYKRLAEAAQELGMSRTTLAMNALRDYVKAQKTKNAPIVKALGSEELAKKYAEAHGKLSKKWWAGVSEEEKKERAQKAVQARWAKWREERGES